LRRGPCRRLLMAFRVPEVTERETLLPERYVAARIALPLPYELVVCGVIRGRWRPCGLLTGLSRGCPCRSVMLRRGSPHRLLMNW
jgi:hypothetical protein